MMTFSNGNNATAGGYAVYGERLKRYREQRQMSQEALALAAGLPKTAITKIEYDRRDISLGEAIKFAEVLQISVLELAGISGQDARILAVRKQASHCVKHGRKAIKVLTHALDALQSCAM